jgi:hypothetical protein
MTKLGQLVLGEVRKQFSPTPVDHADTLRYKWDQGGATVMPCSPLCKGYKVWSSFENYELHYEAEYVWHPVVDKLKAEMEPWQLQVRGKDATIAHSKLCIEEQRYRTEKAVGWYSDALNVQLSEREAEEILSIIIEETINFMHVNWDWIDKYIREHSDSSILPRIKWTKASTVTKEEWRDIFNELVGTLEFIRTHPRWFNTHSPNPGNRARREAMVGYLKRTMGILSRTRIVVYHASTSMYTVFIPQKSEWYRRILQRVEEVLKVEGEFYYPYVEGGMIYKRMSDLLTETGGQFQAYDGKSWEAMVGFILGPTFNAFLTFLDGIAVLGSGSTFTSLLGTIANLVVNRRTGGRLVILGDDMNMFGKVSPPRLPFVELQDDDTRVKYGLGVAFEPHAPHNDYAHPMLTGPSGMIDRAGKAKPLDLSYSLNEQSEVNDYTTITELTLYVGMLKGYFGTRSLIDAVSENKLERDYFAPGEEMERMYQTPDKKFNVKDAAEMYGILPYIKEQL